MLARTKSKKKEAPYPGKISGELLAKTTTKKLRGCGISPAFSFLAEMRLRDNLKSNIYWQLVDAL